ncbi:MAG TPA: LacI family transcriptional regulator [Firmicutes bacterium]|nr:LacI family transcriptional regulator [Bacillota bacterium]
MSNIYEIAKKTKLSPSTVARALSGRGYCSQKARELVLKTAKEMNYVPSQAAKTLRSNITNKILLCIPDIYNPFYFRMIQGVSDVCEKYRYRTILVSSNHCAEKEMQTVDSMREKYADGLIMVSFNFTEPLVERIKRCAVPVVLTNFFEDYSEKSNFDCVYVDHIKATYLAANHLIRRGHRDVVFVGGSREEQTGRERLSGYIKALEANGLSFREEYFLTADFRRGLARDRFREFLESGRPVSAVVTANDLMGVGVADVCHEKGLRIPADLSLVTLDNTDFCTCVYPNLTSVDMKQETIGAMAAELLFERIRGHREFRKSLLIEPELICRESVIDYK